MYIKKVSYMDKDENIQRLCSEIQLFDLCSKNSCSYKKGRFCTNGDILARFEAISDDEDENPPDQFLADEMEEMEEDGLAYDEGIGIDEEDDEMEEEDS
jgi:hypothetical protein